MSSFNLIEKSAGIFLVEGDLTFFNLDKKSVSSFAFLKPRQKICLDLHKVTIADSAGLALLIEWIKLCQQKQTTLTYKNVPQQIITLAELSDFDCPLYFI
jgi:phospholipid transport system transporter-binding protein